MEVEEVYSNYFNPLGVKSTSTLYDQLNSILIHLQQGNEPTLEIRKQLISRLLISLSIDSEDTTTEETIDSALLLPTLSILKHLGRNPAGSEELSRTKGIKILLTNSGLTRVSNRLTTISTELELDPLEPFESESLKCLCNCLMLHPNSRESFPNLILENETWLKGMISLLNVENAGFLAGRLLFLLTSQQSDSIVNMSEEGIVVQSLKEYAERYLKTLQSSFRDNLTTSSIPTPADTLREHFKLAYNLMLQYSRNPLASTSKSKLPSSTHSTTPSRPTHSPTISLSPPTPGVDTSYQSQQLQNQQNSTNIENEDSELGYISDSRTDSSSLSGVGIGEERTNGTSSRPASPSNRSECSSGKSSTSIIGKEQKKKRFWNSGSSRKSSKNSLNSDSSMTAVGSMTSSSSQGGKSPRLFDKLKDVVVGGGSNYSSSAPSSPSTSKPLPIPPPAISNNSNNSDVPSAGELSLHSSQYFLPLFQPYLYLSCLLPLGEDPKDPSPLLRGALNTLLNYPIELEESAYLNPTSSWLQFVPNSIEFYPTLDALPSRLLELLFKTCEAQFPTNVRPKGIKSLPAHPDELIPRGTGESAKAEEILGPVMLLLRKITMLSVPALAMKQIILPDNIDRTIPLEKRTDLTGHLIRLLSSILLPNTAYGVGEFLYNLCDRDPTILCQQIGYGNASGFLQNRGELIPPPPVNFSSTTGTNSTVETLTRSDSNSNNNSRPSTPTNPPVSKRSSFISSPIRKRSSNSMSKTQSPLNTTTTSTPPSLSSPTMEQRMINPITGAYEDLTNQSLAGEDMTQEEKERESERLMVLFERMARSGVIQVENPIDKARNEGKFVETSEEIEKERLELEEIERKEEEEVERDLKAYKDKKAGK